MSDSDFAAIDVEDVSPFPEIDFSRILIGLTHTRAKSVLD
jgi:hypothetical protein